MKHLAFSEQANGTLLVREASLCGLPGRHRACATALPEKTPLGRQLGEHQVPAFDSSNPLGEVGQRGGPPSPVNLSDWH
jgi:hypothetical protein